jgi:hypothetical protein
VSCFSSTYRYNTVHVPCGISIQTSPVWLPLDEWGANWRGQKWIYLKQKRIEMFYSTNQSYHWKLNQSEVDISGRLANQKPGKKNWFVVQNVGWGCSLRRPRPIAFYELALLLVICPLPAILIYYSVSIYTYM